MIEVVAAQLAIGQAVAEHVVGDHQDAVGHRDDGVLVAAALDQPPVLRREIAVTGAERPARRERDGVAAHVRRDR